MNSNTNLSHSLKRPHVELTLGHTHIYSRLGLWDLCTIAYPVLLSFPCLYSPGRCSPDPTTLYRGATGVTVVSLKGPATFGGRKIKTLHSKISRDNLYRTYSLILIMHEWGNSLHGCSLTWTSWLGVHKKTAKLIKIDPNRVVQIVFVVDRFDHSSDFFQTVRFDFRFECAVKPLESNRTEPII